MNILVTSSRFPHALCEIRRFGEQGHAVYAADTFATAPGNHSKYVVESFVTASPTFETERFIADLEEIIDAHHIDLLVPCFEEALYIAEHLPRLGARTHVFCPPLSTLLRLHDKHAFAELTSSLGLPLPSTRIVRSTRELRSAIALFPEYIARPVYSRGGVALLTNAGPLAGHLSIDECQPTALQPWIVQEFVHGTEVCSFSIAHRGRIVAHCAYEHPKTIEHAGGILFESVDEPESLRLAQRYTEALDYDGQISFDFIRTDRGLVMVECNPRPTAGVFMMSSRDFCDAIFASDGDDGEAPRVVPPGERRQIAIAILRDMVRNWREIPGDVEVLLSGIDDVYPEPGDALPALYSLLSYGHVRTFRRHMNVARRSPSDLVAAQFFDVLWDGRHLGAST
ncbi:MAG: ATP-grasp domain-containing protein [Myxococcota bacterium]|nr:ATP-grasp domain-containing protein [Myxococcota bacterium]